MASGEGLPALSGGATAGGHWSLATSSAGVGRCRATMQSADIGRDLGRKVQAADFREGGVSSTSGSSSCAKSPQGGRRRRSSCRLRAEKESAKDGELRYGVSIFRRKGFRRQLCVGSTCSVNAPRVIFHVYVCFIFLTPFSHDCMSGLQSEGVSAESAGRKRGGNAKGGAARCGSAIHLRMKRACK